MPHYPLHLNLTRRDVLVVGAGEVGQRKISSLLKAAPRTLLVIDPAEPTPALRGLLQAPCVRFEQRPFTSEDVEGKFLVFAATQLAEVNAIVAAACEIRGILCNIADALEKSDFFVPASIQSGNVMLTVSTDGASPALARRIRIDLEAWLGNRYTGITLLLGRLRPLVLALGAPSPDNANLFRALVNSDLARCLASGEHAKATLLLKELLPSALHSTIGDLLHDI